MTSHMFHADLDDCVDNSCEQTCTDLFGRYQCSCNSGYTLNDDNLTCSGKARGV